MNTKLTLTIEQAIIEITPLAKSLRGSFKVPKNFVFKKELENGFSESFLKIVSSAK